MKISLKFNARAETWFAAGLIVISTVITYGILIPELGFYRDDWYMLWSGLSPDGPAAIIRLFQTDRPLIGWTFALIFKLIGPSAVGWQVLGLALKVFTGLLALYLLRMVWPTRRVETTVAALLFVLYPGFYQQPVAGTFCIDLIGLNALLLSICLTIFTIKTHHRLLQWIAAIASIMLGLVNLGLYEAVIGLEVFRWILVWIVLRQNSPAPANKSKFQVRIFKDLLKWLAPSLVMLASFLFWRLFIFKSVRRATNINVLLADYASNPFYSLVQIIIDYIKDLLETVVLAWFVPFYQFTAEGRLNNFISALGIALLVLTFTSVYFYLASKHTENNPEESETYNSIEKNRDFLWAGLIAILIPTAVIVMLGRNVIFSIQWDRYTSQSMLGVAILITALTFQFLKSPSRWIVLSTLLVLAVMTHYHSAAFYSRFWSYERNIIWQLSWRAPGFEPGTTLIVSLPEGFRLAEEYEIWGPVNIAYYQQQPMQITGQVPTDDLIVDLQSQTLEKRLLRNINVTRDFGKPLVISLPSGNSCVHVINGQNFGLPFFENGQVREIARYSNINLIDIGATPITPSTATFGPEPLHSWCYYYQKIELALQSQKYPEAARLAEEAEQLGYKPTDATEWLAVIQAYSYGGKENKAAATIKKLDKNIRKYVCIQQSNLVPSSTLPLQPNAGFINQTLCLNN